MTHETIWAPWRLAYIKSEPPPPDSDECFLCRYSASREDRENLVIEKTEHAMVVINRFPYNNGHLLVAPREHKASFEELSDAVLLDCQKLIRKSIEKLNVMNPDGFNVGLNLGRVAGAGLPGHFHWHIVPRWNGDTNFMPVISDTKIIPQSLAALYDLLSESPVE